MLRFPVLSRDQQQPAPAQMCPGATFAACLRPVLPARRAAAVLGMLSTSGGIWDRVNLIILFLIAFEIHLAIGRRCLVPVIAGGSWPAEVSAWQQRGWRAGPEEAWLQDTGQKGEKKKLLCLKLSAVFLRDKHPEESSQEP